MTDALAIIAPRDLAEAKALSTTLAKASLLPEALRGKEADVLMIIMTGAELNLAPMQAIRAIDVIKGRPAIKAEAMVALVRNRKDVCKYFKCESTDATKATWVTQRIDDPTPTTLTFTMEQAKAAGLTSSDMYRKFPDTMLRWRAASMLVKMVYSDIVLGLYSDEEAQTFEKDITPKPGVIDAQPVVEQVKATLKAKRTMNIVDVPAQPSPPRVATDVALDWPENVKGKKVGELTDEQLSWCVNMADKKVMAGVDASLWKSRLDVFDEEQARRFASEDAAKATP
jgi:hypothetical protein